MEEEENNLVYPDLSYEIVGVLFEVYNQLGPGYAEKYYQRGIAKEFQKREIDFEEQFYAPVKFKDENIGRQYLDFLVEDKVILEIKKGARFSKRNLEQVLNYLKAADKKLGILANFGPKEVKFKRIVNIK